MIKKSVAKDLGLSERCMLVLGSHDQICAALGAGRRKRGRCGRRNGHGRMYHHRLFEKTFGLYDGRAGVSLRPVCGEGIVLHVYVQLFERFARFLVQGRVAARVSRERRKLFFLYRKGYETRAYRHSYAPLFRRRGDAVSKYPCKGRDSEPHVAGDRPRRISLGHGRHGDGNATESRNRVCLRDKSYGATATAAAPIPDCGCKRKRISKTFLSERCVRAEGGLCGCAMLQSVAMGQFADLEAAAKRFVRYREEFLPDASVHAAYEEQYSKYKKLYQTLKEFY